MASDELDFEAAMRALGVQKGGRASSKGRRAPGGRRQSSPAVSRSKPEPARPSRAGPPAGASRGPSSPTRRGAAASGPAAKARPVELVEHELTGAHAEIARLKTLLEQGRAERATLAEALDAERGLVQARDAQLRELQDDLHTQNQQVARLLRAPRAEAPKAGSEAGLTDLLKARGVLGADELATVLRGVVQGGKAQQFVEQLRPASEEQFATWLDEQTVLLGDCGSCPAAGRRTVLRVPRARCEVCGGSDVQRAARRFVDTCLNTGTTRITVVGGSPKYHRQLRELIQHRSLRLRLVPGDSRRNLRQARDDLRGSDLVVIWGGTLLDHATSAPYTQQGELGRMLTVQHRGITGMLAAVAEYLSAGD